MHGSQSGELTFRSWQERVNYAHDNKITPQLHQDASFMIHTLHFFNQVLLHKVPARSSS